LRIKTIYRTGSGRVGLVEIERDLALGSDDILVRGKVCGFCKSDVETIMGKNNISAEIFGHEGLGTVAQVGKDVMAVKEGDTVAAFCDGCYGDFYRAKQNQIARVDELGPNGIVQPLATMLNVYLFWNGHGTVLINGCGSNALLLAKIFKLMDKKFDFSGSHNVERMENLGGTLISPSSKDRYATVIELSGKQGAYSGLANYLIDEGKLIAAANPEAEEPMDLFLYSWKALQLIFPSPRNTAFAGCFKVAADILNSGLIKMDDIFEKFYSRNDPEILQSAVEDKLNHRVIKGYLKW
jgi:threonine dehydrogenase-like Zn-dependent dehydrogenase